MLLDNMDFVQELDGHYLLLDAPQQGGFEENMMMRAAPACLLPLHIYQTDPRRYAYEISGRESLLKRCGRGALEAEELRDILGSIYRTSEEMERYLLRPDSLILEPGLMYRSRGDWAFIAHPGHQEPLSEQLGSLSRFFLRKSDREDPETAAFSFAFFQLCHEEAVTLPRILNMIEEERPTEKLRHKKKPLSLARLLGKRD